MSKVVVLRLLCVICIMSNFKNFSDRIDDYDRRSKLNVIHSSIILDVIINRADLI